MTVRNGWVQRRVIRRTTAKVTLVAADVSDLSPAVIQAAAQALKKMAVVSQFRSWNYYDTDDIATAALAAAAPLIRAEALEEAASAITNAKKEWQGEPPDFFYGLTIAAELLTLRAAAVRGLVEEGT
jgi:hypothetical protein